MNIAPEPKGFWIGRREATSTETFEVRSPYDDRLVARVAVPTDEQVEEAVAAAAAAARPARELSAHQRAAALDHISRRLTERAEEIAQIITAENGKPIAWARGEAARAASTFRWAAEEARRFSGELQRLDTDAASGGRLAVTRRFPIGPVLAIAPFNFPLNLVAHKVAPALAVGAPVLVKPASVTPLSALLLGEIIAETDLPDGMVSVLPLSGRRTGDLVTDPRLPVISFTGSEPVGWGIKQQAWNKHVTLELGGNAAVVVHDDWTDLKAAAERIALYGTCQGGQVCVSVQRVLVHERIAEEFTGLLTDAFRTLGQGDPLSDGVQVGPVIDEENAARIESWIEEAVGAGAEVLHGGGRKGTSVEPTLLRDVPAGTRLAEEEAFGPVVEISAYRDLDEALARVNSSRFGLQVGVYTTSVSHAFLAHREIEAGGVLIGEVPTWRADQMPYGGTKASGVGREGVRYAMEDITESRLLLLTGLAL
ncbi:aldehyde dehydrogenase family protein [Streptomyces sp. NPDC004542]|uniref:aldehyde dehydrogenase family protein n=1 Tax=Streptomyces sp. NPDC004542 TaxID=3154281 RepID=UPI0033A05FEB